MAYDFSAKIIILGDAFSGKSAIVQSIVSNTFTPGDSCPTIGVEYDSVILQICNKKVKAMIWDTAGQEAYRSLVSGYYRGCAGAIVVFDVTVKKSFDNLTYWLKQLREQNANRFISIIIAANKIDKKNRKVTTEMIDQFCQKEGLQYIETSACEHNNTRLLLRHLVNNILINTMTDVKNDEGVKSISSPIVNINKRERDHYCSSCSS